MTSKGKFMRPFFCYFGGKWRVAKHYPTPVHSRIIEPFAGAAGYSLHYAHLNVTLYDLNPVVFGVWDYLIKSTAKTIRKLPINVEHVDDHRICQEAKWLIGFWLNKGGTTPKKQPSTWAKSGVRPNSYWGEAIRERIANQVNCIRHWKIFNESYEKANNTKCTWFIDPPYDSACGRIYPCRIDDYEKLGEWCRSRKGQVVVCERVGANWLPFEPFRKIKALEGKRGKLYSEEMIWLN